MRQDTTRIVLYSHDALGLGHLRRNLALAHRLAHDLPHLTGASVTGLLVAGLAPPAAFRLPPGFDWLILPGFTKDPDGYRPRRLRDTPQSLADLRHYARPAGRLRHPPGGAQGGRRRRPGQ